MTPILESLKLRCLQIWAQDGSPKEFKELSISMEEEQCRITIKVTADSTTDENYPKINGNCLLDPKPEPCGIATEDLPWPSKCRLTRNALYTAEEDERLLASKEAGLSWSEIAETFPERSIGGLAARYRTLLNAGSEPRPPSLDERKYAEFSPEEDALLKKLRDDGKSLREIAKAFSRRFPGRERTVDSLKARYRYRFGRHPRPEQLPFTPEEDARLRRMREEGTPWNEMEEAFPGRSMNKLIYRYYGILEPDPSTRPLPRKGQVNSE